MELPSAAAQLKSFSGESLRKTIGNLERDLRGSPVEEIPDRIPQIGSGLLEAAVVLKQVAGQVKTRLDWYSDYFANLPAGQERS